MTNEKALTTTTTNVPTSAKPDVNPALVYLSGLTSHHSQRTMRTALENIASLLSNGERGAIDFPWAQLRYEHTQAIRARLAEKYAPATVNKMLSALRGVLTAATNLGQMTADNLHKATAIKSMKGSTLPTGRELSPKEIRALARVCREDETPAGVRDAAMIGVLYTTGMRRSELTALDLADYDAETGKLDIRHGKGNRQRTVYLADGAQEALDNWIKVRGSEPGALFCAINRHGRIIPGHMADQAVYTAVKKRGEQAGIENFSPHDLRRSFVSDQLDAGTDLVTVQKIAGHASPVTTSRYDRRGEESKRKAAKLLRF